MIRKKKEIVMRVTKEEQRLLLVFRQLSSDGRNEFIHTIIKSVFDENLEDIKEISSRKVFKQNL